MCIRDRYAAVDALKNSDEDVKRMRESYDQRRRYLLHAFREMGMDCFEPLGAFYIFPSIRRFGMSSDDFAMELLKAERVAVVPGTAFGQAGDCLLYTSIDYLSRNEASRITDQVISQYGRIRH